MPKLQNRYYFFSNDAPSPLIKQISISKQGKVELGLSVESTQEHIIKSWLGLGLISRKAKQRNSDLIWIVISGIENCNTAMAILKKYDLISDDFYQQFSGHLDNRVTKFLDNSKTGIIEEYNSPKPSVTDFSIFPINNTNSKSDNEDDDFVLIEEKLFDEELFDEEQPEQPDEPSKPTCSMM